MLSAFRDGGKSIVVPVYRGRRGHPVIFSVKYRDELLALTGDEGARSILGRYPSDILEVSAPTPEVLADVDTVEDYEAILEWERRHPAG